MWVIMVLLDVTEIDKHDNVRISIEENAIDRIIVIADYITLYIRISQDIS